MQYAGPQRQVDVSRPAQTTRLQPHSHRLQTGLKFEQTRLGESAVRFIQRRQSEAEAAELLAKFGSAPAQAFIVDFKYANGSY